MPGKVAISATKQLVNQRDLALAYSPGVAAACEEIVADPANAFRYTSRGNLVAVITNGTAVLGLGNIGPLAAKPVMEGKGVLFKKFAGIDVFDIEVAENDLDKLVDCIAALEPTFGGINLEDIKAPDCFYVERALRERMKIPVFHDDQHGTAIVVGAAVLNALKVTGKDIKKVKLVTSGAGAAALACLGLLVKLGVPRENIWVTDLAGVVYEGRTELMDEDKIVFAQPTEQAHAGRGDRRRRRVPRPVGGGRAQARDGRLDGGAAGDPRARQPDAGDHARAGACRCAATPSSPPAAPTIRTRSTTSCASRTSSAARSTAGATTITVRDGDRRRARHRRAGAGRAERGRGRGLRRAWRSASGRDYLIPKPFDPRLMMKIAPAVAQRRRRVGRGDAADHRLRRLPRQAADLRLRLRADDAADLQPRQDGAEQAHRLRRGRGGARAARGAGGGRRGPGAADADRPARGDRRALPQVRPAPDRRHRLRPRQHRARRALPRLLADLPLA